MPRPGRRCAPTRPFAVRCRRRSAEISAPRRASAWMCVSSRRRPITSPPGGGTIASPQRATSGPASRIEARMRVQSSASSSVLRTSSATILTTPPPWTSTSTPRSATRSSIVATSLIAGTFLQRDRLFGEQGRRDDRQGGVLVPRRPDGSVERATAFDDEGLHQRVGDNGLGHRSRSGGLPKRPRRLS